LISIDKDINYENESFGWVMDAPVVDGPYQYFSDPQYVGTTFALLGHAVAERSPLGLSKRLLRALIMRECDIDVSSIVLTVVLGIVFAISVKFLEVFMISMQAYEPHINH